MYHTDTGREYQIHSINDDGKGAFVYNNSLGQDAAGLHLCPVGNLTHQRPVLDADGAPIKKDEHVFGPNGGQYRVTSAHDGKVFARHVDGPSGAEVESAGGEGLYRLRADQLTHTKPEPTKRFCRNCAHWQKDPTADNMGVCWFLYHEYEGQD